LDPKLTGKLRIGGVVSKAPHPSGTVPLNGAPQMVEVSRDGRRIYFTNSLYGSIDAQLYPDGIRGWMVKVDAKPGGGIEYDRNFFVDWCARSTSASENAVSRGSAMDGVDGLSPLPGG
jgi:selenium-binding protein 1